MTLTLDPETIARVLAESDIVEVIGKYVPLIQAGRSFKALCPFHSEKTPSFMVNPDRQIFYCFGCGEGGDAARFLQRATGMTFAQAILCLSEKTLLSLPIPEDFSTVC